MRKGDLFIVQRTKSSCETRCQEERSSSRPGKCTAIVKQLKSLPDPRQLFQDMANKFKQKQRKIASKKGEFASQISKLKEETKEAEDSSSAGSKKLEEKIALIGELEGRIDRRNDTQDDLQHRIELVTVEIDQLGAELLKLKNLKERPMKEIGDLETAVARVQADDGMITRKYETKHAKILSLTKKLEQMLLRYQIQRNEATRTLEQKRVNSVSPFETKIAGKQKSLQQCKESIETHTKGIDKCQANIAQLEKEGQTEKTQFQKVKDQYNIQFQAQAKIMSTLSMNGEQLME
jgi:chromosome segregation ATPase